MTADQIARARRLAREFKARPAGATVTTEFIAKDEFPPPAASASGFFVTEDGFLITSERVVRQATRIQLLTRIGMIVATVVKVDATNDLALLKAEGRFAALPVAASRAAGVWDTVAAVGFAEPTSSRFAARLTEGEIAALSGVADDPRYFRLSVQLPANTAGGALVDQRGNVVGVMSGSAASAKASQALKSSVLLDFLATVPELAGRLGEAHTKVRKFTELAPSIEPASAQVRVY